MLWRALGLAIAVSVLSGGVAPVMAAQKDLDQFVNARSVHCEFFAAVRPADTPAPPQEEPKPEVLVHYGGLNRERTRAFMLSTRGSGAREAIVLRTDKAVHFVDYAAGVFMVTTVFSCIEREQRTSARHCVTYAATNSRHFDASVFWQPDSVFERYRAQASHGFCDHSFVTNAASARDP